MNETNVYVYLTPLALIFIALEMFFSWYYRKGYISFQEAVANFGTALGNFGVRELLDGFVAAAPPPQPRETAPRPSRTGSVVTVCSVNWLTRITMQTTNATSAKPHSASPPIRNNVPEIPAFSRTR